MICDPSPEMVRGFILYKTKMNKNVIYADLMQISTISPSISFAIHVKRPVEMPPRIYNINYQEVFSRSSSKEDDIYARVFYDLLSEKVIADYNCLIEDFPIMDMFADPIKYEQCSFVEFNFINTDRSIPLV